MVSATAALQLRVPPLFTVTPAIVAAALTVTVWPLAITTVSVVAGTVPPGQGASGVVEFQFPLPVVVICAAWAWLKKPIHIYSRVMARK